MSAPHPLLAAVYADPDALAPRLVYADHLTDLADPRGEFIGLQLRPWLDEAGKTRVRTLLAQHREAWLAPLAGLMNVRFWRGFPASASVVMNAEAPPPKLDAHEWRTITALDFDSWGWSQWFRQSGFDPSQLFARTATNCRRVSGLPVQELVAIAAGPPNALRVARVVDEGNGLTPPQLRRLGAGPGLSGLRHLEVELRELPGARFGPNMGWIEPLLPRLLTLTVRPHGMAEFRWRRALPPLGDVTLLSEGLR